MNQEPQRAEAVAEIVGAENRGTQCDLGVFVDQATGPVPAQNPDVGAEGGWTG